MCLSTQVFHFNFNYSSAARPGPLHTLEFLHRSILCLRRLVLANSRQSDNLGGLLTLSLLVCHAFPPDGADTMLLLLHLVQPSALYTPVVLFGVLATCSSLALSSVCDDFEGVASLCPRQLAANMCLSTQVLHFNFNLFCSASWSTVDTRISSSQYLCLSHLVLAYSRHCDNLKGLLTLSLLVFHAFPPDGADTMLYSFC